MNKALIAIIALIIGGLLVGGTVFLMTQPTTIDTPITASSSVVIVSTSSSETPVTTPQAGAPVVTSNQNATPSKSTALLTGSVNPNGASTAYWYDYGLNTNLGSHTAAQNIGASFMTIPSPGYITGLKASTLYFFRLSAQNQYGTITGSIYSFKTNNNPLPEGSIPTVQTSAATDITRVTANLHGQLNANGAATTYWFEYGENVSLGNTAATFQSIPNGTASPSVTLSGLKPLTRYYFRLNGQNQYGTITGTILNFTTKGPAASAPTVKTDGATDMTVGSAKLNGRVNPNDSETTYLFEYSKDSSLKTILGTVSPLQSLTGATSLNVESTLLNLSAGTRYYYRVTARNQYGTTKGNIVSFRTK